MSDSPPGADVPPGISRASSISLEYTPPRDDFRTLPRLPSPGSLEGQPSQAPPFVPPQVPQVSIGPDALGPGAPGSEEPHDIDLFGPETEDQPLDDDYSPPFGAYVAYANDEQVTESLPVFATTLSTLAAFITEPRVIGRIRNLAGDATSFDNTITPIYNNIRTLVNQWNSIVDNDIRVRTNVSEPVRPQPSPSAAFPRPAAQPSAPASAPIPTRQVPPATAARRAMRIGGVPTHHTVQTTLPFAPAHNTPPPIPIATRPPPTFAQVVKNPNASNVVLDTARMLTAAMPDAPAATIFDMASRMAPTRPANRATPKHAPRGASKVITVKPAEGTHVNVSQIPNDQALLSEFALLYENAKMDERLPEDAPDVLFVRWMSNTLHIQFRTSPIDGTEMLVENFWNQCPGLNAAQPVVSKFRFRNGVLYRRVPFPDPSAANSPASVEQIRQSLLSQPAYDGITLIGNPRVQIAEGSTYGNVFVDFHDSSTSRCMRQIMRQVVYINGSVCRAVQAHNFRPAVPRCAICQRWGHSSQICRSPVVRCPICAQAHDEREHDRVAANAPAKCFNCNEAHRADSPACTYFQHRRDREWIEAHPPAAATQAARNIPHIDLRQQAARLAKAKRGQRIGMGRITN